MAKDVTVTIKGKDDSKAAIASAQRGFSGLRDTISSAINPVNLLKSAFAGIGSMVARVMTATGAFYQAAVVAAMQSEAAWARVESAVTNVGVVFGSVRGELDKLFSSLERTTRYSDDEASDAFATLVRISGDYAGSTSNLTLAADLAAAKQIGLGEAATLVGKAMIGQTRALREVGIEVKDGANAMDALRERYAGFATRDAATLEGRLHQVANAWDNIMESIGRVVMGNGALADGTGTLAGVLGKLAIWIDENAGSLRAWVGILEKALTLIVKIPDAINRISSGTAGRTVATAIGTLVIGPAAGVAGGKFPSTTARPEDALSEHGEIAKARKAAREAQAQAAVDQADALHDEIDLLLKAAQLRQLNAKEAARLAAIEKELRGLDLGDVKREEAEKIRESIQRIALARKSEEDEARRKQDEARRRREAERKEAEEYERKGQQLSYDLTGQQGMFRPGVTPGAQAPLPSAPLVAPGVSIAAASGDAGFGAGFKRGLQGVREEVDEVTTSFQSLGEMVGDVGRNSVLAYADAWGQAVGDIITGHESLAGAIVKSARKAVAGALGAEGQRTLLRAAEAAAEGFHNPIEFVRAAKLLGVGTAELALASQLGGGGGSGGSGGGGLSASSLQQSQNEVAGKAAATVIVKGRKVMFDMRDPDDQAAFVDMVQHLTGTRQVDWVFEDA